MIWWEWLLIAAGIIVAVPIVFVVTFVALLGWRLSRRGPL